MERSLVREEVLPFAALLGSLVVATIIADALLHQLGLVWIGRYLGIPGTIFILLSFFYSLRKRKLISVGKPKTLLNLHQAFAWLALVAMLVNVISGMTGKYLLDRSRRFLAEKKEAYVTRGLSGEAMEKEMFWDATAVDLMKKWRAVHFPITLAFAVLGLAHILSIFLFWQWR